MEEARHCAGQSTLHACLRSCSLGKLRMYNSRRTEKDG